MRLKCSSSILLNSIHEKTFCPDSHVCLSEVEPANPFLCVCVRALSQKHQPLSIDREDQWKPNTDCTNDHVMDEVSL